MLGCAFQQREAEERLLLPVVKHDGGDKDDGGWGVVD